MTVYEVECVTIDYGSRFDDCRAIEAVGFEAVDGGITRKTPAEVHDRMVTEDHTVYVTYHGERSDLEPVADGERQYVRAAAEDTDDDPLLKQPSC